MFDPDKAFGELLFPVVSIFVAIILFEGGLNLKFKELKTTKQIILRLISIGILVTWVLITAAAYYILKLDFLLSLLLGAILVVTGPTVIIPLLREIKIGGQINSITKWEGIVNDPVGALIAVLVYESIVSKGLAQAASFTIFGILKTVFISSVIGLIAGIFLVFLLRKRLIPDYLQNPLSISLIIIVFAISNLIQPESGLFAVTISGIYLANQKYAAITHILEFKENLRTLFITFLFMLLASRLKIADLEMLDWNSLIFVGILILIVRPAAVFISTIKTNLNLKEKIFLSWMAPRGIVAAAVASVFALELMHQNVDSARALTPLVFLVIISTILVYGISARPLAKFLKLTNKEPRGFLILGAHPFALKIARIIKENNFETLLVDTNRHNISKAKLAGFNSYYGSILSENIEEKLDLNGIGRLIALSPNEKVNSLAAMYFSKFFTKDEVYQLSFEPEEEQEQKSVSKDLQGKLIFDDEHTYYYLEEHIVNNKINSTTFTKEFTYDDFLKKNEGKEIIKLFLINEKNKLIVYSAEDQPVPKSGQKLIYVITHENN